MTSCRLGPVFGPSAGFLALLARAGNVTAGLPALWIRAGNATHPLDSWYEANKLLALKFSIGSQELCSLPYPTQDTKYCSLLRTYLCAKIFLTSYSRVSGYFSFIIDLFFFIVSLFVYLVKFEMWNQGYIFRAPGNSNS